MNTFLWMLVITVAPFIELRGAIPFGIGAGLDPLLVIVSCITINILLIPALFFVLTFVFHELENIPVIGRWIKTRMDKIHQKAGKYVDKYGPIGLALFVGVPLPGTGAYSGVLAAFLLTMEKKRAMGAIAVGVIIAGLLISLASLGIFKLF
ncbi:MAG: small multi-drug export protein [archaeon]